MPQRKHQDNCRPEPGSTNQFDATYSGYETISHGTSVVFVDDVINKLGKSSLIGSQQELPLVGVMNNNFDKEFSNAKSSPILSAYLTECTGDSDVMKQLHKEAPRPDDYSTHYSNDNKSACRAIIKIKIEDCNGNRLREANNENCTNKSTPHDVDQYLPLIGSALDVRQLMKTNTDRLKLGCHDTVPITNGSLSDNTHEKRRASFISAMNINTKLESKRLMRDRLRNWKKSNKIITNIHENPFNMHMDFLERLSKENGIEVDSSSVIKEAGAPEVRHNDTKALNNLNEQQQQRLQTYAAHLTHLYKKNQTIMDNNADFRNLLYNIICCLLIQDDQVLSTISVTKMIDVIRTHLDSTAKFYSNAILTIANSSNANVAGQHPSGANNSATMSQQSQLLNDRRKGSLGSLSCTSSNSSGMNACQQATGCSAEDTMHHLFPVEQTQNQTMSGQQRRQKPVDFRRVSSVSYNDVQLINDLCDTKLCHGNHQQTHQSSDDNETKAPEESPWKFEELSSECKHHNGSVSIKNYYSAGQKQIHVTSSSSSENNHSHNINDLMNDSGIGTIYDFSVDENGTVAANNLNSRTITRNKRHSDSIEYKPKQKPPYMSTDDYLSNYRNDEDEFSTNRSVYDNDGESSMLQRRFSNDSSNAQHQNCSGTFRPVDVASRRSELEWTLNKLINFELKYVWLTSRDTLRRAIRRVGVPNEIRAKVWMILIDQMIGDKYDAAKLLEEASRTIEEEEENGLSSLISNDNETQSILKQIELDVNRTMPGHKLFDDGAEGGIKLRRILVAYSIHVNRAIAYCQGFNFIVALLLSILEGDEEKALR